MNLSRPTIDESYDYCRRMSCRAGSNFHAGFLLLPREKRRAMDALYAFMRYTDDLIDGPSPGGSRHEAIASWRAAVCQALSGENDLAGIEEDKGRLPGDAILPALRDVAEHFRIPHEHLLAVIDGVAMDLGRRRYETFEELRPYCERVASSVGLACIHVWGFRGEEALSHARSAGIALQLINILRDLREDIEADRLYLPLADLRKCDYSVDDLRSAVVDERFQRLVAMEVARAEEFFRDGVKLMDRLESDGRRIFGLMMATYDELLRKIARRPAEILRRRIRVGRLKRLQLMARWTLLPARKGALR